MAKLIVVDDEKNIRHVLAAFFESRGHEVLEAPGATAALELLAGHPEVQLLITDLRMHDLDGLGLLEQAKLRRPDLAVVLMSAHATVESAVRAMNGGALDFLSKPLDLDAMQRVVDRALARRGAAPGDASTELPLFESQSPAMQALLATARRAANSDSTLVLFGESGAGKNVLARQIHDWSPRRAAPFVPVNCTTLSEQLLESELFGHVRGAFTGAVCDKPGRLEGAAGGTVFLDELADLAPRLQAKLLRFLQEHRFERIGSAHTIEVDARVIAASNRDLEERVAAGQFREDLFYRLNVITLRLPTLRERPEDLPVLIERFLAAGAKRSRCAKRELAPDALRALMSYDWPGNVRELRNAIERACVLCRGDLITCADLPEKVTHPRAHGAGPRSTTLADLELDQIRRVVAGSETLEQAAEKLGISVTTLWRKRKRHGIH
ncbi:MAG TPA: sigma-54 dependent transcriptional regulator [Myxococcota bacterium]|nr:sigma-54 dependent transcriptional regulator [Myxococcota bacterium]